MERRNTNTPGRLPGPSQVDPSERHQIESHVERVQQAARAFVGQTEHDGAQAHLATWRVGAVLVATEPSGREAIRRGFSATRAFLRPWGLDDLPEPAATRLVQYLDAETVRRIAATTGELLSADEVHLVVDVGRRWGRGAARAVLAEVVPYFIELELGTAATVAADVQRAIQAAA